MYVGIMPFFLAMLAVGRKRNQAKLWLLLAIVAYLFAIGPEPKFAQFSLDIVLPWTLPIAPILRHMYRMMILMSFGLAMLAAYGWLGLRQSLQYKTVTWQALIACLAGLAIYGEYTAVPFPSTFAPVSPFYTSYLDDVPQDVALATVPTGRRPGRRYLYYQTYHNRPITGGVVSRAGDDVYAFIRRNPLLRFGAEDLEPIPFPNAPAAALQELADANVGFLVIDKKLIDDVTVWRNSLPTTPVFEDELVLVYGTESSDKSPKSQ